MFSVLSVHCVVRGLGASFLYKFPASRGGFLRQRTAFLFCIRLSSYDPSIYVVELRPLSFAPALSHFRPHRSTLLGCGLLLQME